ncbi:MAG: hypothetical protein JNJ59_11585 [Deltaproteobacteria bacterium]|nr:hypothetical protein [Deltaproteobacteria bacterium]
MSDTRTRPLASRILRALGLSSLLAAVLGWRTVGVALAIVTAGVAEVRAASPEDITRRQDELRRVLETFDLPLSGDVLSFGPRGRRDLVLFSPRPLDPVLAALKAAYREERRLAYGYVVAGWAHLVHGDSWTITLKDASEVSWVAELSDRGPNGLRVVLWGVGRDIPSRRPMAVLPMRLVEPARPL